MGKQINQWTRWPSRARRRWGRLLGVWAVLLGVAALPVRALAHAQVVRSSPADQARLTGTPTQAEVWFSELLEEGFNAAEVFPAGQLQGGQRTNLAEGHPKVDPQDRTHLIVKVRPLPPGEYVFEWRVLSRDGHSAPGRITFRVLAPNESALQSSAGKSGWNTPRSTPSN